MEWMIGTALIQCPQRDATHLANFDEKVHKPQSRLSISDSKAELLQPKPHPFICMRNFINIKVGNRKN